MNTDLLYYRAVLTRIKSQKSLIIGRSDRKTSIIALQKFLTYGLGSAANGKPLMEVPCANTTGHGVEGCMNIGVLRCSRCALVKYCSGRCQRQHWFKHRHDCEHPFLDADWQPSWLVENRPPVFSLRVALTRRPASCLWGDFAAYDILQLNHNEGLDVAKSDFKLCFSAVEDIRNLVKTVNSLPKDFRGKCDILLNNEDAIVVNRNLVILYALLAAGPTIEESAELATHLMYSIALQPAGAAYLRRCVHKIYGEGPHDGDMSFHSCLKTRGRGKLYSTQTTAAIKRPREMFFSSYELPKAKKSVHTAFLDPVREDDRQRTLDGLKPAHRLALTRFWHTGILIPYSMGVTSFSQPNRLLFSSLGQWLGPDDGSPLHGWDTSAVQDSGRKYGLDPADILGCLFFYVRDELREFAARMKEFNIDIHFAQYNARVLSRGIATGVLPAFSNACFDRVDTADMVDQVGVRECLAEWGPLLRRDNPHATVLMHSKSWHVGQPHATARYNPNILELLRKRCRGISGLEAQLKAGLAFGQHSPFLLRLIESMDAFVDHEEAFLEYLGSRHIESASESQGLRLRESNRVHPKRLGVPLHAHQQKLPDLSKHEFYDLFTLGGADFLVRFIEFEPSPQGWDWAGGNEDGLDAATRSGSSAGLLPSSHKEDVYLFNVACQRRDLVQLRHALLSPFLSASCSYDIR